MSSAGLLTPPTSTCAGPTTADLDDDDSSQRKQKGKESHLWEQTWKRLERFLPQLKSELYPPEMEKEKEKEDLAVVTAAGGGQVSSAAPSEPEVTGIQDEQGETGEEVTETA